VSRQLVEEIVGVQQAAVPLVVTLPWNWFPPERRFQKPAIRQAAEEAYSIGDDRLDRDVLARVQVAGAGIC